jgi:hypothetical protein
MIRQAGTSLVQSSRDVNFRPQTMNIFRAERSDGLKIYDGKLMNQNQPSNFMESPPVRAQADFGL